MEEITPNKHLLIPLTQTDAFTESVRHILLEIFSAGTK